MTSRPPWMALSGALGLALGMALFACKPDADPDAGAGSGAAGSAEPAGPVHAPEVAAAITRGHDLFFGKAMCSTCHRVGDEGAMIVGPNMGVGDEMSEPFAVRAPGRAEGVAAPAYVIDSILDPNAVVVPGYARGVMKSPDDIPIELSDDELVDLAAFVLSIGASEAITPAALDQARAEIPVARAARDQRRGGP